MPDLAIHAVQVLHAGRSVRARLPIQHGVVSGTRRVQHEHRVWLLVTGQPEEVTAAPERVRRAERTRADVTRRDHQGVSRECRRQQCSTLSEILDLGNRSEVDILVPPARQHEVEELPRKLRVVRD